MPSQAVRFVKSACHHWGSLVTGGFFIGVLALYQATGHRVAPWFYWAVAMLAVFPACFKAWEEQYQRAEKASAEAASLRWPEDRPKIAIVRWGQVLGEDAARSIQNGFYLLNHGGAALEVTVESFPVLDAHTKSITIPQIGPNKEGFAAIWIENQDNIAKWGLDVALGIEARNKINSKQMLRDEALAVPVSVVYRDFNNLWYRSSCTMTFSFNRIGFSSVTQAFLGITRPA
jgi:hypothetical protein